MYNSKDSLGEQLEQALLDKLEEIDKMHVTDEKFADAAKGFKTMVEAANDTCRREADLAFKQESLDRESEAEAKRYSWKHIEPKVILPVAAAVGLTVFATLWEYSGHLMQTIPKAAEKLL